jgi:hypothetical protein
VRCRRAGYVLIDEDGVGERTPDMTGLVVMLCLPFLVWLLSQSWMRRLLRPVGLWLWARVNPVTEPDAASLELWHALRRQQLQRDLDRVRRLIADDAWMSATRQVGNRMAYEQLLAELADLGPAPALQPADVWTLSPTSTPMPSSALLAGPLPPSTPYVEILELGPGPSRRTARRQR